MKIQKIITHDGMFHADEIFAIALIFVIIGIVPVMRTRELTAEDFDNSHVWILDVGRKLDHRKHNIDHHQDEKLNATNMIVLDYLLRVKLVSPELYDELYMPFNHISNIDKGGYNEYNGFQVNSLIKSLNALEGGFDIALGIAIAYINTCLDTVVQMKVSKEYWNDGQIVGEHIKICDQFPIHWKRYKQQPFLIVPNDNGKMWNLHSVSSEDFPIQATGKEEFIHKAKFLAVYNTKGDAVNAALSSLKIHKE